MRIILVIILLTFVCAEVQTSDHKVLRVRIARKQ